MSVWNMEEDIFQRHCRLYFRSWYIYLPFLILCLCFSHQIWDYQDPWWAESVCKFLKRAWHERVYIERKLDRRISTLLMFHLFIARDHGKIPLPIVFNKYWYRYCFWLPSHMTPPLNIILRTVGSLEAHWSIQAPSSRQA